MEKVMAICREIIDEAQAIMNYTEDIGKIMLNDAKAAEKTAKAFLEIRDDEVEHIQKLALALTREVYGDIQEEGEAEQEETEEAEENGSTEIA